MRPGHGLHNAGRPPVIEPTDEMEEAFYLAGQDGPDVAAGLAAVLAVVERDYDVRPKEADRCSLHQGWAAAAGKWIDCTPNCLGSRART